MSSPESFPAQDSEAAGQQAPLAIINCLRQRASYFLEAANSFAGVTAVILPLDTRAEAAFAATEFCISHGLQERRGSYSGTSAVADSLYEHREEFSVVAVSGIEAWGLCAFQERVEALYLAARLP